MHCSISNNSGTLRYHPALLINPGAQPSTLGCSYHLYVIQIDNGHLFPWIPCFSASFLISNAALPLLGWISWCQVWPMPSPGLARRFGSSPFGFLQVSCLLHLVRHLGSRPHPANLISAITWKKPKCVLECIPLRADPEKCLWEQLDCTGDDTRKQWKRNGEERLGEEETQSKI